MSESFPAEKAMNEDGSIERLLDVSVEVTVELGRRRLTIGEVVELKPGSTIEFHKPVDEALDIRVNGHLVARGEAVVMGDRYGVRVSEVVSPTERIRSSTISKDGGVSGNG